MKGALITFLVCFAATLFAQKDECPNVDALLQKIYKHYEGDPKWQAVMDSVLAICPNNARIWDVRAHAHLNRGDFVTGMKHFEKVVELDPAYYLGDRAWCRMTYLHDYKGAIADLDQLEKHTGRRLVYVTSTHMYIYKANAYEQLGDFAKALELYNIAIDEQVKERGEGWVGMYDYLFRGILKNKVEDYDGAIDDLTKQVEQYESLADTYYYRALAYAAVGRKQEARADLEKSKALMLGEGQRRWDALIVVHNEVYLSDVETALVRLN